MPRLVLLLAFISSLLLHGSASAQQLAKTAENLQSTLFMLKQEVAAHVPKGAGRTAIYHDLEDVRGSLQKVREGVLNRASRGEVASKVYESRKNFDRAMNTLGEQRSRPNLQRFVYDAGGQITGIEQQLLSYTPALDDRGPAGPSLGNLDDRARNMASNYLSDRFRVSKRGIDVFRMVQTGNKYRVYARVPGVGSYVVTLDAVGGSVFSAESIR